ncbi:peptide/nickel transport system substrate-binding protein [Conyzicola lurida]|uniref:Peptide/nickel transport system substrate-binding protein n=1 Tax=Conyzicola lurida TaxID=1172621 RepID=A0A841AN17_9MICO|nr:ABC transporter substrate-binding protein [Conyzicola lurida]MBB5842819.1 peptide/nickel transport system substrate-binding protein [Conyzicola lurida]
MKHHRLALPAIAAAAALALSACASGPAATTDDNAEPVTGGSLTWGVSVEPVCYNPQRSGQQNSFPIIRNFAESLVGKDSDGEYTPWLADSWDISEDGLTYDLHLREGVEFTDGTVFDAEAVKTNLDFVADPANATAAGTGLTNFSGATVIDANTIELTLKTPDAAFLDTLASITTSILSPASLALPDNDLCAATSDLVGTGPFILSDYQAGQEITFTANEDYDSAPGYAAHTGRAYLDSVTYRFLPEATVRTGALSSNQVDIIEGVQVTDTTLFQDQPGYVYETGPSTGTAFSLNVNTRIAPADDARVRQALRDGFDLDALVENQYLGTVQRAFSSIGPDSPFYDESLEGSWGNDVDGANDLLDEAGWTERDGDGYRTKDGERLTIVVGYPEPYIRDQRDVLLQAIQAQVKENIGLDLDVQSISSAQFTDELATSSWTVYPNTLPTSDPSILFRSLFGSEGFLYAKDTAASLDELIAQSRQTSVASERKAAFDEIQQTVVDDARYIPLYHPVYTVASTDLVHGISFEPQLNSPASSYDLWTTK